MKYSLSTLIQEFNKSKGNLKYIFFWGHTVNKNTLTKACFSQWYPCKFEIDSIIYYSTEQYMMSQKAILFNDFEINKKILEAKHPKECKTLGRMISNFSENKWNQHKYNIVVKGNIAKFSQNLAFKEFLLNTKDHILVEASPYDKIWGIGRSKDFENINNPTTWLGDNLLGFALMEVRDFIKDNEIPI